MTAGKKPKQQWLVEYRYAHRGLHDETYPENTIPAFLKAAAQGYAIELDVHLSKDGELVVFHDGLLERMTGKQGRVEDYTAKELQTFTLGKTRYTIPLLKEVLEQINGGVPILIETKNEGMGGKLEVQLYEMMRKYQGRYAVQSFSPFSIGWFKKNAPEVLRGQLSGGFAAGAEHIAKINRVLLSQLLTNFLCRPNFISYEEKRVNACVVQRLKKGGIPVLCWTVRSEAQEKEARRYANTVIFEGYCPEQ